MSEATHPFELALSSNAKRLIFNEHWSPQKHYQASFNAQTQVVDHLRANKQWGLLSDWRRWLALTPEHERLCVRCMDQFAANGMRHFAVLIDDHPVTRWQLEKVQRNNPNIVFEAFEDLPDATAWLQKQGYDVDFKPVTFNRKWLYPSDYFEELLDKLGADKSVFIHQPSA